MPENRARWLRAFEIVLLEGSVIRMLVVETASWGLDRFQLR